MICCGHDKNQVARRRSTPQCLKRQREYGTPREGKIMIAQAWNNGSHHRTGAGYGIKIATRDRDRYFRKEWKSVTLLLEGIDSPVEVNTDKPSFWATECRELISKEIGLWLRASGKAPWSGRPVPQLELKPLGEARFSVRFLR